MAVETNQRAAGRMSTRMAMNNSVGKIHDEGNIAS